MNQVSIQIQDAGGNWVTVILSGYKSPEEVFQLLQMAKKSRPGKILRAVTREQPSPIRNTLRSLGAFDQRA